MVTLQSLVLLVRAHLLTVPGFASRFRRRCGRGGSWASSPRSGTRIDARGMFIEGEFLFWSWPLGPGGIFVFGSWVS